MIKIPKNPFILEFEKFGIEPPEKSDDNYYLFDDDGIDYLKYAKYIQDEQIKTRALENFANDNNLGNKARFVDEYIDHMDKHKNPQ